jgi:hypothetical protein
VRASRWGRLYASLSVRNWLARRVPEWVAFEPASIVEAGEVRFARCRRPRLEPSCGRRILPIPKARCVSRATRHNASAAETYVVRIAELLAETALPSLGHPRWCYTAAVRKGWR